MVTVRDVYHHLHGKGGSKKDKHPNLHLPKGYLAVMVGQDGDWQQRFVVPVAYLSHPLFVQLLKAAEEEYGFEGKGAIAIPCDVEDFLFVQGLIDRELFPSSHHGCSGGGRHHHHFHHVHHSTLGCFRAWDLGAWACGMAAVLLLLVWLCWGLARQWERKDCDHSVRV